MLKSLVLFVSLVLAAQVSAGPASAVSADDAYASVAQGAFVVDVRAAAQFAAGHVPQASWIPERASELPLDQLAALLGKSGIDSSRTMLIVGEAGDANAQALWQRLAQVTSGRVLWLVGGVQEWQMRGYALTVQETQRTPVPQFLASFETQPFARSMAGSRVRSGALLERDFQIKTADARR